MQKTKFPAVAATFIVCFVFWVLLDFSFKVEELIAGAVVSLLVALFSARFFIQEDAGWFFNPSHLFAMIGFWFFTFVGELIKANLNMARICFGGCKDINPGIVKVPTEMKSDSARIWSISTYGMPSCSSMPSMWKNVKETDPEKAGEAIKGTLEKGLRRVWQ